MSPQAAPRRIKIAIETVQVGDRVDQLPDHVAGEAVIEVEVSLANVYLTLDSGYLTSGYIGQEIFIWRVDQLVGNA